MDYPWCLSLLADPKAGTRILATHIMVVLEVAGGPGRGGATVQRAGDWAFGRCGAGTKAHRQVSSTEACPPAGYPAQVQVRACGVRVHEQALQAWACEAWCCVLQGKWSGLMQSVPDSHCAVQTKVIGMGGCLVGLGCTELVMASVRPTLQLQEPSWLQVASPHAQRQCSIIQSVA